MPEMQMSAIESRFADIIWSHEPVTAFRFEFDMEFTSITATTADGTLTSVDEPSRVRYPSGATLGFSGDDHYGRINKTHRRTGGFSTSVRCRFLDCQSPGKQYSVSSIWLLTKRLIYGNILWKSENENTISSGHNTKETQRS